ncbi:MAG: sigma-54-dependent Fis family transcriptional regulator, partial [Deltaproteobacteria bacterium]
VNCAAIPSTLLESELFGYEKGAFTSAVRKKKGKFEVASGGTIFLDEISEMSPRLQSKLLQAVQDGSFSPVGSEKDVEVDVRIISATNQDLERAVREGNFREDLFFRLNVVNIHLPPLRERKEDIPALAGYFLQKFSDMYNKKDVKISDSLMERFIEYDWPGNIRQLENFVKRIVIMGSEAIVQSELSVPQRAAMSLAEPVDNVVAMDPLRRATDVPKGNGGNFEDIDHLIENIDLTQEVIPLKEIAKVASQRAERLVIEKVLNHVRWNRRKAAKILDISYKALLYKMKECGIVED